MRERERKKGRERKISERARETKSMIEKQWQKSISYGKIMLCRDSLGESKKGKKRGKKPPTRLKCINVKLVVTG